MITKTSTYKIELELNEDDYLHLVKGVMSIYRPSSKLLEVMADEWQNNILEDDNLNKRYDNFNKEEK